MMNESTSASQRLVIMDSDCGDPLVALNVVTLGYIPALTLLSAAQAHVQGAVRTRIRGRHAGGGVRARRMRIIMRLVTCVTARS